MRQYKIRSTQPDDDGGISALVEGPGIGRRGIRYYFETQEEMRVFIERLNLILNRNSGAGWIRYEIPSLDSHQ